MLQVIGCPAPGVFFSAIVLVAVLFSLIAAGGKWLLGRILPADGPAMWPTLGLTVLEPVSYLGVTATYVVLARTIWAFEYVPAAVFGLGAALVFVASAGAHGDLQRRANPDIGDWRQMWLSVLYALPVPAIAAAAALAVVL